MNHFRPAYLTVAFFYLLSLASAFAQPLPQRKSPTFSDQDYGRKVLSELSSKYTLVHNHPQMKVAQQIVRRLTSAARVDTVPWQVHIFDDDTFRNASATRGNYVFIWTGMLDVISSDEELTALLAHVIAHVLAGHTHPDPVIESQKMLIGIATTAGHIASGSSGAGHIITNGVGNIAKAITRKAERRKKGYYYSQSYEDEADRISMLMLAGAGNDPREVLFFWMRARNDRTFEQSVQFFRMHPPYFERLQKLTDFLPEANKRKHQIKSAWQVVRRVAVLFSQPREDSKAIGEFSKGARVVAVRQLGEWVEIESPDHGFLRTDSLKRLE